MQKQQLQFVIRTKDLKAHTSKADIVIIAVGFHIY